MPVTKATLIRKVVLSAPDGTSTTIYEKIDVRIDWYQGRPHDSPIYRIEGAWRVAAENSPDAAPE